MTVAGRDDTPPVQAVIFDLDGTLVQTRVASWEVFAQVNERYGLGVDQPAQYFDLFRGNVFESIRGLCRDEAQANEVTAAFLELLRKEYTPPLVPGMADVVRRLASHCTLVVISSNAMEVLRRILVANDLAYCFAHVFSGDVEPDKRKAIRAFLSDAANGYGRRCVADYDETGHCADPNPAATVLVTDTAGDVRDARAAGIRVVGVSWGMHTPEQLVEAGAEFVALWPQELPAYLLGDAAAAPVAATCAVPAPRGQAACGKGECRCGCRTEQERPSPSTGASRRRERRRAAAVRLAARLSDRSAERGGLGGELLAAVRRVCGRG